MKNIIYAALLLGGTFTVILSLAALVAGGGLGAGLTLFAGIFSFLIALKALKI